MNYINQLNIFYRIAGSLELNSSARMLYLALLHKDNTLGWIDPFTCAALELEGFSGLSSSGLQRARKQLIDKKLIGYEKRGANRAPRYRIYELSNDSLLTILNNTPGNTLVNSPNNTPGNTPNDSAGTLSKPNKTKSNYQGDSAHARNFDQLNFDEQTKWREYFTKNVYIPYPKSEGGRFEAGLKEFYRAVAFAGANKREIVEGVARYAHFVKAVKRQDRYISHIDNWLKGMDWQESWDPTSIINSNNQPSKNGKVPLDQQDSSIDIDDLPF